MEQNPTIWKFQSNLQTNFTDNILIDGTNLGKDVCII